MPANLPLIYGCPSLLDRLMDQAEHLALPAPQETGIRHFPPMQIFEDDEALHIRALAPGMSMNDLHLTLDSGTLSLRGVIPISPGCHFKRERHSGPFRRDISIPFPINGEAVEAVIRNGILTITLPKAPAAKKRSIPVDAR